MLIEIDDSAEISNSTARSRDGSERMGIPQMMGIPQRADTDLPAGASLANAVQTDSQSSYQGEGSVSRNEKLQLKIAATVADPEVQKKLRDLNVDPRSSTPEQASALLASDIRRWSGVIARANIPRQ